MSAHEIRPLARAPETDSVGSGPSKCLSVVRTAIESQDRVIINRLTVDGKDYFLPEPVTELRGRILEAIKAGGGYVNIPPLRSGPGIDILFSPGMPVTWAQIEVGNDDQGSADADAGLDDELGAL